MPISPGVLQTFEDRRRETPSRYEEALQKVVLRLAKETMHLGFVKEAQVAERVAGRIKDVDSVAEKVERALEKAGRPGQPIKSVDELEELEKDIVGVRCIFDYLDQVMSFREFVVHSTEWRCEDPEEWLQTPQRSGYRSVHINIQGSTPHYGDIWCEVQLRTLNQHSWAEKSHPLIHKRRDVDIEKLPQPLLTSMRVLSDLLWSADELAVCLRDLIRESASKSLSSTSQKI